MLQPFSVSRELQNQFSLRAALSLCHPRVLTGKPVPQQHRPSSNHSQPSSSLHRRCHCLNQIHADGARSTLLNDEEAQTTTHIMIDGGRWW
jgi:hypothetical protein